MPTLREMLNNHGHGWGDSIDPEILGKLPAQHNVTNDDELLFDEETLGTRHPNQRWDVAVDTIWQVNELRLNELVCLRKRTQYGELHQSLWALWLGLETAYYFIYSDGESGIMGVARIVEL